MSFHLKIAGLPIYTVTTDHARDHDDPRRDFSSFAYRFNAFQQAENDYKVFCLTKDFPKLLKQYAFSYHTWCCVSEAARMIGYLSPASDASLRWHMIPKEEAFLDGENAASGWTPGLLNRDVVPSQSINPADLKALKDVAKLLGITLYERQPLTEEYVIIDTEES